MPLFREKECSSSSEDLEARPIFNTDEEGATADEQCRVVTLFSQADHHVVITGCRR